MIAVPAPCFHDVQPGAREQDRYRDRRGRDEASPSAGDRFKGRRSVHRLIIRMAPGEVNLELGLSPKSNSPGLTPRTPRRLLGRFPWLTAWLRRRSARLMARQRSPEA